MKLFFVATATAFASVGHANPTTNIFLPVATTLGHREVGLLHSITGAERLNSRYENYSSITVGLYGRFELGATADYLGQETWSAKALLWDCPSWAPHTALAVGFMNIYGGASDHYAIGRVDLGPLTVHGGYGRFGGVDTGLIGINVDIGKWGSVQADHSGGPDGTTWVAHSYPFARDWYWQIGVGRANRKSDGWQHGLTVGYGFSF